MVYRAFCHGLQSLLPWSWLEHPVLPSYGYIIQMTMVFQKKTILFVDFFWFCVQNYSLISSLVSDCKSNWKSNSAWFWKGWARRCHLKGLGFVCLKLLIKFSLNQKTHFPYQNHIFQGTHFPAEYKRKPARTTGPSSRPAKVRPG